MGAVLGGVMGRRLGGVGVIVTVIVGSMVGVMVSLLQGYEVLLCGASTYVELGDWVRVGVLEVRWGMQVDRVIIVMVLVVIPVATVIEVYALGYMGGDKHVGRFMTYMGLFTGLMVVLVTADNYMEMFVGWEGVGLCSYLLIGYWGTRVMAIKGAVKAIIVNRLGDVGLLVGMLGIYEGSGSLSYAVVDGVLWGESGLLWVSMWLLLGAMGKSAQLGLLIWLVDAMEGPTPVSALIHAATMVTAGVYLLVRAQGLYVGDERGMRVVAVVGGLTALMGGLAGMVQNDIKKVIAYSTIIQLGYMVSAAGVGAY